MLLGESDLYVQNKINGGLLKYPESYNLPIQRYI